MVRIYEAESVDDYIARASEAAQPVLSQLREIILKTVPNVDERISWGVPFYRHHGLLAGFSVFKSHVSFGFTDQLPSSIRERLEDEGYKTGAKTFQIGFDQKIPAEIIRQMLLEKVAQNDANETKK